MNNTRGSKRAVEKILVSKGNLSLPTDGTALNGTGGIVNLSDGQVGLLDVSPTSSTFNQFFNNSSSLTFEQVPVAKVVQGTETSANPSAARVPFTRKPYESSVEIVGSQVISYTGKAYAGPKRSSSFIPAFTPVELSTYTVRLAFRGKRVTEYDSGIHAVVGKTVAFNTPEYSTLGLTSDADHFVQNLAYQINQNSRQFAGAFGNLGGNWGVFALAFDISGGSGTAISAITAGTSVPVVVANGVTKSVIFDQELVDTLADAVANTALTTSSTIELIDLSVAGSDTTDSILLVALNEQPAYIDRDPTLKIRLDVGLADQFETQALSAVKASDPFEGQGTYRQWKLYFENTNGQRSYSQNRDLYPVLVYPTSLVENETYGAIILEHYFNTQVQFTGTSVSPHKTIILVPNSSTAKATIVDAFNDWLAPKFPAVTI